MYKRRVKQCEDWKKESTDLDRSKCDVLIHYLGDMRASIYEYELVLTPPPPTPMGQHRAKQAGTATIRGGVIWGIVWIRAQRAAVIATIRGGDA